MKRPFAVAAASAILVCAVPVLVSSALASASGPSEVRVQNGTPQQPLLIAHRGGTADYPENTLLAVEQSLKVGADGEWLSVQVTKDDVPVLYRPKDLVDLTDGSGTIANKMLKELSGLNAGYRFQCEDGTHCYRAPGKAVGIPTLEGALKVIPEGKEVYLDLKQVPADHIVRAVTKLLDETGAWDRVRLYSTDAEITRLMGKEPRAQVAESRDDTRQRLAEVALEHTCKNTPTAPWAGFELKRKMSLTEKFALGQGDSPVFAQLWTKDSVACFTKADRSLPIIMFGVNSKQDLATAAALDAHAVLVDSPKKMIDTALGGNSSHAPSAP